jgi:hypothetical protein
MDESPTAETVQRFRQATGLGWMASKRFLIEQSPELCARIVRAGEEQERSGSYHDPIGDDSAFASDVAAAREKAERIVQWENARKKRRCEALGLDAVLSVNSGWDGLRIDVITQKLLQRKGIQWYRRMEMSPHCCF